MQESFRKRRCNSIGSRRSPVVLTIPQRLHPRCSSSLDATGVHCCANTLWTGFASQQRITYSLVLRDEEDERSSEGRLGESRGRIIGSKRKLIRCWSGKGNHSEGHGFLVLISFQARSTPIVRYLRQRWLTNDFLTSGRDLSLHGHENILRESLTWY